MKTFKELRNFFQSKELITKKCREVGPYYYSKNKPNGTRERQPGYVASLVLDLAHERGFSSDQKYTFGCSWAGKWPRTVKSLEAENKGVAVFYRSLAYLQESGYFND